MKDERDLNGHLAVEEKRDGELRAREEPEPVQEESSGIGTEEVFEDIGKEKTGRRAGPTSEGEGEKVSLEKQFPKEPTVMDQDWWTWVTCRTSTRQSRLHASATMGSMRITTRPARRECGPRRRQTH